MESFLAFVAELQKKRFGILYVKKCGRQELLVDYQKQQINESVDIGVVKARTSLG